MSESYEIKRRASFEWIRSEQTGTGYLCPKGSFAKGEKPSEEQLRAVGVDESLNPHND